MSSIKGFRRDVAALNGGEVAYAMGGEGPPVLLLHGFPQTHAMWHAIAPLLAERFTVVAADLRGYGDSHKPDGIENYSFREMGADQRALMAHLGFDRFHLVGHDRGGRTAHRLALDAPETVASLTMMDIIPTHMLFDQLSKEVARAYYHWFFLIQPAPFPEHMIGADPDFYFESALTGWGSASLDDYDADALETYRTSWRRPETIAGMCNDYRAAYDIDFALDAADLGRKLTMPALILYGADGAMGKAYDVPGTWADRLAHIEAAGIPGGHFFPDTAPEETAAALMAFLSRLDPI